MPKQLAKESLGKKLIDNSYILNEGWNNTNNSDSGLRGEFANNRPIGSGLAWNQIFY